jgi:hypothetical protein
MYFVAADVQAGEGVESLLARLRAQATVILSFAVWILLFLATIPTIPKAINMIAIAAISFICLFLRSSNVLN